LGTLAPSGKAWKVDEVIESFINETERFVESYFGDGKDMRERIIDFDDALEQMKVMLRRIKKGLRSR
jgi:hypothetical protein